MALSVGIFRARSQRPTQRAIRQKFVVPTKFVATQEVPGFIAKFVHDRAYKFVQREGFPPPDWTWQAKRPRSFTKFVPPAETPGIPASIRKQREQFYLTRKPSDVSWQLHRPRPPGTLFVPPPAPAPGFLATIRNQRQQFEIEQEEQDDVQWQLHRPRPPGTLFVPPPPVPAPGWLERIAQERALKYRQLRRVPPDVRWQLKRHQRRWVVPAFTPPSVVETPGVQAAIQQQRQQLKQEEEVVDVQWQLQRPRTYGVFVAPPVVDAPGWKEALYRRKVQYPRLLERAAFDVRWQLKKPPVFGAIAPPPVVPAPGFLAAIRQQRQQPGVEEIEFDVRWQIGRRRVVSGIFVPPSPADIGWLVSWMTKRAYGHNLRR